jgi:hypothetical protein
LDFLSNVSFVVGSTSSCDVSGEFLNANSTIEAHMSDLSGSLSLFLICLGTSAASFNGLATSSDTWNTGYKSALLSSNCVSLSSNFSMSEVWKLSIAFTEIKGRVEFSTCGDGCWSFSSGISYQAFSGDIEGVVIDLLSLCQVFTFNFSQFLGDWTCSVGSVGD